MRDWIVPVNRRYNLRELMSCLAELFPRDNAQGNSVLIEYIMLRGINDTEQVRCGLFFNLIGCARAELWPG